MRVTYHEIGIRRAACHNAAYQSANVLPHCPRNVAAERLAADDGLIHSGYLRAIEELAASHMARVLLIGPGSLKIRIRILDDATINLT